MNALYDHSPQPAENDAASSRFEPGVSAPSRIMVRAKLEMTSPGDSDEQEAEAMADAIVGGGKIARSVSAGHSGGGVAMPSQMGGRLSAFQGHGSRMYGDLKDRMETGFGRDFSDVSLHTDDAAAEMSSSIGARAFTYGSDIYFGRGQFSPDTTAGQHLLAHELAHVSQGTGKVSRQEDENNFTSYDTEKKLAAIRFYSTDRKHLNPKLFDPFVTNQDNRYNLPDQLREQMLNDMDKQGRESEWNAYQEMVHLFIDTSEATIQRVLAQREKGEKVDPVNVAIRMSMRSDYNGAFLYGFESLASIPRLIVLQEVDSVKTCTMLLKYIDEVIAPIQNLIICGHGESDGIELNPEHSFSMKFETAPDGYSERPTQDTLDTIEFFKEVGKLMKEKDGIKKKIVFDACLTASHKLFLDRSQLSFAEFAFRYLNWESSKNLVAADALTDEIQYSYDTSKNELFATNHATTTQAFFSGNKLVIDDVELMSRYVNDRAGQLYVGFNASEFTGLVRGIAFKYYLSRDAAQLKTDLDLLKNNFERMPDLTPEDLIIFETVYAKINTIQQDIDEFLEVKSKYPADDHSIDEWLDNYYFYFIHHLKLLDDLIPFDFSRLINFSLIEVGRDRSVFTSCISEPPQDTEGQMSHFIDN